MMQPYLAANDTDDVMLAVAAVHPGETVVDHPLRQAKAADPFELPARCNGIGRSQIEVVDTVGSDAVGRVASPIEFVARWRVYFETQAFRRGEGYGGRHAVQARLTRKNS